MDDRENGICRFRERENGCEFLPGCPLISEESLVSGMLPGRDQNRKLHPSQSESGMTPHPPQRSRGLVSTRSPRSGVLWNLFGDPDFFGRNDGKRGRMILFETHA